MKKISIIIPVREINDYIKEAMPYLQNIDYPNYEILIFPDSPSIYAFDNTTIIPSGRVGPAEKRDMAIEHASGEFLAFIDDDAYPCRGWLKKAIPYFDDVKVGAVGGPAVTPPDEELIRMASGKVYESKLCSGEYVYRYIPTVKMDVKELPSVNFIVRASDFKSIGGFDTNFYPGEDMKICHSIVTLLDKKIIYDPEVLVWHHRRKLFKDHIKQVKNYAKIRSYLMKNMPETAFNITYCVPALFVIGLIAGPMVSLFINILGYVYFVVLLLYVALLFIDTWSIKNLHLRLLTIAGIFITHLTYGIYFLHGVLFKVNTK